LLPDNGGPLPRSIFANLSTLVVSQSVFYVPEPPSRESLSREACSPLRSG